MYYRYQKNLKNYKKNILGHNKFCKITLIYKIKKCIEEGMIKAIFLCMKIYNNSKIIIKTVKKLNLKTKPSVYMLQFIIITSIVKLKMRVNK